MPGRSKFTKRKSAPRRRMVRKKRNPTVLVNRALHPIAQRYITKMKYCDSVTTDANGRFTFNLNSVFDPNRTGVGRQPYSFDQLAIMYNRYRVIACGWRISAQSQPAIAGNSFQLACQPSNEVLLYGSMAEMKENPRAKYIIQTLGGGSNTLSGKIYLPSLVGRSKAQYMADDRYQASVASNPDELAILNILSSGNGGDVPSALAINVLLEYTVEFFDIKHLPSS